jgi:hypothetical protein
MRSRLRTRVRQQSHTPVGPLQSGLPCSSRGTCRLISFGLAGKPWYVDTPLTVPLEIPTWNVVSPLLQRCVNVLFIAKTLFQFTLVAWVCLVVHPSHKQHVGRVLEVGNPQLPQTHAKRHRQFATYRRAMRGRSWFQPKRAHNHLPKLPHTVVGRALFRGRDRQADGRVPAATTPTSSPYSHIETQPQRGWRQYLTRKARKSPVKNTCLADSASPKSRLQRTPSRLHPLGIVCVHLGIPHWNAAIPTIVPLGTRCT